MNAPKIAAVALLASAMLSPTAAFAAQGPENDRSAAVYDRDDDHINCSASNAVQRAVAAHLLTAHITAKGRATVKNDTRCDFRVGMAVYSIPSGNQDDQDVGKQKLEDSAFLVVHGRAEFDLTADASFQTWRYDAIQEDIFYGNLITSFAGGERYGDRKLFDTDDEEEYASDRRGPDSDNGGSNKNAPEVPFASVFPAIGALTYGAMRLFRRRRAA